MKDRLADHVAGVLQILDLVGPDFDETPERVARWLLEMTRACRLEGEVEEMLSVRFPATQQLIVIRDVEVVSLCPHHLLPVEYSVSIGYLPAGDEVLGLSKVPRVARLLGLQPTLQESYGNELADVLCKHGNLEGCGVQVVGSHACMRCRGVQTAAQVVTSALRGVFLDDAGPRDEFLRLCSSSS